MPAMKQTLGQRIRRLRKDADLTQVALASKAGVAQSVISDLERDVYDEPSASLIAAIASVLMKTPQYILTGEGEENSVGKLAPAEHDLLHLFRLLEPTDQQRLLGHAKVYLGVDVPAPSKRARKQHPSE